MSFLWSGGDRGGSRTGLDKCVPVLTVREGAPLRPPMPRFWGAKIGERPRLKAALPNKCFERDAAECAAPLEHSV